ncbi:uncharacterized protein LOC102715196 [Oryza brachyantha]|uniref:uncharacterized protein LOC102715196 n=1 Tax=Oryza brachyantha TaxID=4533 RepID=UPI001ADAA3E4|nr:uncharacterized protein LOC102715196 [Oryza brachyantha]
MDSAREQLRIFLLEEEEEDDELFFALVPAALAALQAEKRPLHTSILTGSIKVKEILEGHENWSKAEFRMEPEIFRATARYLSMKSLLCDTRGVDVEEQLGMFMYMISHNASNQDLQNAFQHSGETISRKINEVFHIVPTLAERFVKLPDSTHTHMKIASDPRFWPYFQIQEKEKELKGNYKVIKNARKESGVGWNDSLCMIVAEPAIWDRILQAHPKVKKFRSKPFPLFNQLALLYEGSVAPGDLCFTSTQEISHSSDQNMGMTHEVLSLDGLTNPFSNMGAPETSSTNMAKEAQESSTPNKEKEVDVGKKRKHNQVALVLEDYLEFKKEQAKRAVGKIVEASRHEIDTSISKCIATIESIQELTDEEKAKALGLFRCPLNREIFMNTSIPSVRLIWLKSQIAG